MTDQKTSGGDLKLATAFLSHLPAVARQKVSSVDGLEQSLLRSLAEARAVWPEVELNDEMFLSYLAQHFPEDCDDVDSDLETLRVTDLYLACACLEGNTEALKAFDAICTSETKGALYRMDRSGALAQDVCQVLSRKLLLGDREKPPKLAQYRGKGKLGKWIRVAAVRTALNMTEGGRRERRMGDQTLEALASPDDHELAFLKTEYRKEFKSAFHEALATLSSRERNLLRHQVLDRLSIDELGELYKVHRSTAARWLERIRSKLQAETRRALMDKLKLGPTEFESIVRLVISQFDASLHRVLTDDDS